ncbi:MAG TPA: peptide-N-glycosidase F-related protein [Bacteroidales bacterium]|nr:peptide-N-glycosidase F-related protein [Bacteroidales bacterium]
MNRLKIIIFSLAICISIPVLAFDYPGDTVVVHAVSFDDPSPEGWQASYHKTVIFPKGDNRWGKIIMVQWLKCDSATKADKYMCGEWDYIWDTYLKIPKGDTTEIFSIGSFVTPYGKRLEMGGENGWQWTYDVTDYAPLLQGTLDIVTGNNQELLDLKFLFIEGLPERDVLSVQNIYPYGEYTYGQLADDSVLSKTQLVLDKNAKGFRLKARISGHGHAGPHNCCEWDSKTHTYYINDDALFRWNVWKDCGNNPIYPQGGTWPFNRAGWCPGTKVDEYEFELTPKVTPGDTIGFDYGIEYYADNGERDGHFRMSHQMFSFGASNANNDASIVDIINPTDKDEYSRYNPSLDLPRVIIKNSGAYPLKNLFFTYGLKNGRKSVYRWHGNLSFLETEEVYLPLPDWTGIKEDPIFIVEISKPNGVTDENDLNNYLATNIEIPMEIPERFVVELKTNNLGRPLENRMSFTNMLGECVFFVEDFKDDTTYRFEQHLEKGAWEFAFTDDLEDGISVHWWNYNSAPDQVGIAGSIVFYSMDGEELYRFKSDFGQELRLQFFVGKLP